MTRNQLIALLATLGAGFGAGSAFDYSAGPPASITYPHALRFQREVHAHADGGFVLDDEVMIAYRTRATEQPDGGLDLEDIGPAGCTGADYAALRTFVRNNCPLPDGGLIAAGNVYVVEATTSELPDGGASVGVHVYSLGAPRVTCTAPKTAAFRTFVGNLSCTPLLRRANTRPL